MMPVPGNKLRWYRHPFTIYLVLFTLAAGSRLLTAIDYIEDPDSLRFALALKEYDINRLQPHFPWYPVFCFATRLLYIITGSINYAFALTGGISTELLMCALFSFRFSDVNRWASPGFVFAGLLTFFNPFLWLMANRFMPDLAGVAVSYIIFSKYLNCFENEKNSGILNLISIQFLTGLSTGIKLTYAPLLMLPACHLLYAGKKRFYQITALFTGFAIWFIPLSLKFGLQDIINLAWQQFQGHLHNWGGTYETEPDFLLRLKAILIGLWAHGMGGYLPGRHWLTLVLSSGLVIAMAAAGFTMLTRLPQSLKNLPTRYYIIAGSIVIYLIWIFLYQNVVYKPRHILPLLPIVILMVSYGFQKMLLWHRYLGLMVAAIFLAGYIPVSLYLQYQHQQPTAIAQITGYLQKHTSPADAVVSLPLVNYFLSRQAIHTAFINIHPGQPAITREPHKYSTIYLVGDFHYQQQPPDTVMMFYHNPYVNAMWHTIPLKIYKSPL